MSSPALANLRSWLSWHYWNSGGGAALIEGFAVTADTLSARFRDALRTRFPSVAPADALPEIAATYNLEPPADLMTTAALRSYLADPWAKWAKAGTRGRIIEELALLGLTGLTTASIVTWRNLADGGNPGAFGGDSSCWYLELGTTHPFVDAVAWDGGALWDAGERWDFDDPTGQDLLPRIERVIRKWKPASSSCRFIRMTLPSGDVAVRPLFEDWEIVNGVAAPYYSTGY